MYNGTITATVPFFSLVLFSALGIPQPRRLATTMTLNTTAAVAIFHLLDRPLRVYLGIYFKGLRKRERDGIGARTLDHSGYRAYVIVVFSDGRFCLTPPFRLLAYTAFVGLFIGSVERN